MMDSEDPNLQKSDPSIANLSAKTEGSPPLRTFAFPKPTTTLAISNPTSTFSFSNPTTTLAISNPTSTFSFSNPTSTFSFSNPTSTFSFSNPTTTFSFSNANTTLFKYCYDTKQPVGIEQLKRKSRSKYCTGKEFSEKTSFCEKCKLDNAKEVPICIESSSQTELCFNKLLQGLEEMLLNNKHSDFVLNVKGKEFSTHKIILAAHSPVFAAMIEHDTKEKATGIANIDDFEPVNFTDFLIFLYTGKADNLNFDNVFDLYEMADKYQVTELSSLCIKYMTNNISIETFCDILTLGLRHYLKELIDIATQFFLQRPKEIAMTARWGTFLAENPVAGNELFLKALNSKTQ